MYGALPLEVTTTIRIFKIPVRGYCTIRILKFQFEVTATIGIFKIPVPVLLKRVFSDMNLITFTAMT